MRILTCIQPTKWKKGRRKRRNVEERNKEKTNRRRLEKQAKGM
jgi:hypothetical protein